MSPRPPSLGASSLRPMWCEAGLLQVFRRAQTSRLRKLMERECRQLTEGPSREAAACQTAVWPVGSGWPKLQLQRRHFLAV